MNRLAVLAALALAGTVAPAFAQKPATGVSLPAVGESLPVGGAGFPGGMQWLYDIPSPTEAAGRVVIHWFCTVKVSACVDDLARIVTLKENGRVYIVAYINTTSKAQLKKLDPIRGSEGVGRGTVAYGKAVVAMFKNWSVLAPTSIVTDVDGKVAHVTKGMVPAELDARDAKVNSLAAAVREYVATPEVGPKNVVANQKFTLGVTIKLASWLRFDKRAGEFTLTLPKEIKCDAVTLRGEQLTWGDQSLTAKTQCSGPRGSYEARGQVSFRYAVPNGAAGLGTDGQVWKFEIKP
ncbi:MAG TPA: hypothetical protein VIU61_06380 [Kofleriaceae bacterium]